MAGRSAAGTFASLVPADALNLSGLTEDDISSARLDTSKYAAYIELHNEQGPILERRSFQIGISTGIVSIIRHKVTMHGRQNQAGTIPMEERTNAMRSAAEFIAEWSSCSDQELVQNNLFVQSIGTFSLMPNSPATVPREATFIVEHRSLSSDIDAYVAEHLHSLISSSDFAKYRLTIETVVAKPPVTLEKGIISTAEEAASSCEYSYIKVLGGASHDAASMAHVMPAGMIFVPSIGRISHSNDEFTPEEDMIRGLRMLT